MIVVVVGEAAVFGSEATAGRHVGFAADDRFDACFFGFAVELDRPEHVAMVGHRHGRLIERFDLLDERLDLIRAVEQTELGMEMEMNEGRSHGGILGGRGRGSQTYEKEDLMQHAISQERVVMKHDHAVTVYSPNNSGIREEFFMTHSQFVHVTHLL